MMTNEPTRMTLDDVLTYVENAFADEAAEEEIVERLGPILLEDAVFRQVITAAWEGCRDEIIAAITQHAEKMRELDAAMAH